MLESKFVWDEKKQTESVSVESGSHSEIERLFLARQLGSIEEWKQPDDTPLVWHDPFCFADMQVAVDRIKQAAETGERVLVYGDYDADGTTSTALLLRVLRDLGVNAHYYIPHRFFEGYGPNLEAFTQAIAEDTRLIVTVDCGITATEEAALLQDHGVDLIVVDHHQPKAALPHAVAIVHPEVDAAYPFDRLAGAGVALKLVEALRGGQLEDDDVMLAMFGTVGDVVDLVDENRSIVKRGLLALRQTTAPGVLALLRAADLLPYEADETDVAFTICPRLNAPGRMDDASVVVELLLATDETVAFEYAREVEQLNAERKAVTTQMAAEALALAQKKPLAALNALVLYRPDWHEGVLGIVASRLVDQFGKAVVMLTDGDAGDLKGSGRAPEGFDLLSGLVENDALLSKYGGHMSAAGLSLAADLSAELEDGLNRAFKTSVATRTLSVDLNVPLAALDFAWLDAVNRLAPFGQGNRRPVAKLTGVCIEQVRRIGATHEHLKMVLTDGTHSLDAIFFKGAPVFVHLTPNTPFDVLCEVELNVWNGNKKLQARVLDIRCEAVQLLDLRNQKLEAEFGSTVKDGFYVTRGFASKEALRAAFVEAGHKNVVLTPLAAMSMPTREQFVFVYQAVKTHGPFHLNADILAYFERGGISKAMLTFIVKVMTEIGVLDYAQGRLKEKETDKKVDFKASLAYQSRAQKVAVQEFLELSTATEILKFMTGEV